MTQSIRDLMTTDVCTLEMNDTVERAAQEMARRDIGDVVVCEAGEVCGIVTDRDITVRVVAEGREMSTPLRDVCTGNPATLSPDDSTDDAVRLMTERAVRRLPVVDRDRVVGIISLGDLAIDLDSQSALADISEAPANN